MRVAIIDAGPAGLSQIHALKAASNQHQSNVELVCFDKQRELGGQWTFSWRTGLDEFGENVHSGMYRGLLTNIPKELMEYGDCTFKEHLGRPIPSFVTRAVILDYLRGRAAKFGLGEFIRFGSVVRMVTFDQATARFTVTVHNLVEDKVYTESFDCVINAVGHFSVPNIPSFPGMEAFSGEHLSTVYEDRCLSLQDARSPFTLPETCIG